jgi:hypothetical protein
MMIGIDPRKASRWVARYHDVHRLRTQAMCRVHAVGCELLHRQR